MLWVSWLFFNGGSTLNMFAPRTNSTAKIFMNTMIAGGSCGLVATFLKPWVMGTHKLRVKYDLVSFCNGLLAGCVAITAPCAYVYPWAAFVIGLIAGIIYTFGSKLLKILDLDDPVEAGSLHGFCGAWGLIAAGFFDETIGIISHMPGRRKHFGW